MKTVRDYINLTATVKEDIKKLCSSLNIETPQGKKALQLFVANAKLLDNKQKDYGPDNIASFGEIGVLVRSNDKIERLKYILKKPSRDVAVIDESLEDTWSDWANYGIIGLMLRLDTWSNNEETFLDNV